jgi:NodT family efflux transporter outer membrane factor (OMF) lipoprotein
MLALTVLAGCTVGPRYRPPAAPTLTGYTPAPSQPTVSANGPAGTAQHFNASAQLPPEWWQLFQSPALDGMVREALAKSPTLAQATARLKQAQEELRARTGATKYPAVTGNTSVEEEQVNLAAFGVPFPNPSPFTLLNGSIAVSYALDIFGGNRREIEALRAEIDYEQWQIEGARLMLAGNVVSAAIRQAELQQQIAITRQMLAAEQQQAAITEHRRAAGGATDFDVDRQQTLVAQTQSAIPGLEQQLDTVNDQLAVLMGRSPGEAQVKAVPLDSLHLPQELPITLPSSLVRQRPDIRAAEALLHRASAEVGVATANLYPQIVLSGSGGAVGTSFISGGPVWNAGAGLTQPIFKGGELRAEQRKAVAAYDEAGSAYQQTVLAAFQQVADTLYAIQHDAETLRAREQAANQAAAAYQIASDRYRAGGISQLALLDARRQQLQTAVDRTSSAAARFADSATLFEALGGGWWNQPANSVTPVPTAIAPQTGSR